MTEQSRYFLTVDWCDKGNRGIFCRDDGTAFYKETPHTKEDYWQILDCFSMVLSPKSELISEEELREYNQWYPLAEYSNKYGYAVKSKKEE